MHFSHKNECHRQITLSVDVDLEIGEVIISRCRGAEHR